MEKDPSNMANETREYGKKNYHPLPPTLEAYVSGALHGSLSMEDTPCEPWQRRLMYMKQDLLKMTNETCEYEKRPMNPTPSMESGVSGTLHVSLSVENRHD